MSGQVSLYQLEHGSFLCLKGFGQSFLRMFNETGHGWYSWSADGWMAIKDEEKLLDLEAIFQTLANYGTKGQDHGTDSEGGCAD